MQLWWFVKSFVYSLYPLSGAIVFFLLRKKTDFYYILNKTDRKIYIHRGFAGMVKETALFDFDQVFCVTPLAKQQRTRFGFYWEYKLGLLLRHGKKIRLSDVQDRLKTLEMFREPGEAIARWLNVPFIMIDPKK